MRLLLDTHILLWAMANDPQLKGSARKAISEAEQVYVSAVTVWEVAIKVRLGKLHVPHDLFSNAEKAGVLPLPITWAHAQRTASLPDYHSDPFDRLLIAQAQCEKLTLVTRGKHIRLYDVSLIG